MTTMTASTMGTETSSVPFFYSDVNTCIFNAPESTVIASRRWKTAPNQSAAYSFPTN